eukprot:scaffold2334_cov118-Cylindrotheca_fusiformis.AAC.5
MEKGGCLQKQNETESYVFVAHCLKAIHAIAHCSRTPADTDRRQWDLLQNIRAHASPVTQTDDVTKTELTTYGRS